MNKKQMIIIWVTGILAAVSVGLFFWVDRNVCKGGGGTIFFDGYNPQTGIGWLKPVSCRGFWGACFLYPLVVVIILGGFLVYIFRGRPR